MGTLVSSGNALGVVISIGSKTEFGKIFQEMKDVESKRSPLQEKMDELGMCTLMHVVINGNIQNI